MSLRHLRIALLAAVVLLGQWLAFAHAAEHSALTQADSLCAFCVSGIGSAPPPVADASPMPAAPAPAIPGSPALAPPRAAVAAHLIRGPPTIS